MQTAVKIVPEHVVHGFQVEWFFKDHWNEYGYPLKTVEAAERYRTDTSKFENWPLKNLRVVPKAHPVAEFPSRRFIEEMWLRGYQGARDGENNPYSPDCDNHVLWAEGAAAFNSGKRLFA